jgi:hypothetical protein
MDRIADVTLVKCPKCQSQYWNDIPDLAKIENTKWRCARCGFTIVIGACAKCKAKKWKMTKGIDPLGGQRPFYRILCLACRRVIGFLIVS